MSRVNPVHREVIVTKSISEVLQNIMGTLQALRGKIAHSDDRRIECDFGSLLKSRLLGEFWVSKSTLPKRVTIELKEVENGNIAIIFDVRDTHKYGILWGCVKKYEKALEELADSILSVLE